MATTPKGPGRKRGLALMIAGVVLGLVALVRGFLVYWRPVPDTWEAPELTLDAALLGLGLGCAIAGFWLFRRSLLSGRNTPVTFLTADEEHRVMDAIKAAEAGCSGEIRVHLHGAPEDDVLEAGRRTFERLGMTATRERNGVLFFVAVPSRRFAVLGDTGIHERVPERFWEELTREIEGGFRQGRFADALAQGVARAGAELAKHFPCGADNPDELPDEISRD